MDKLPPELFVYIAQQLDPAAIADHAALKNLRLVDKKFTAVATPIPFGTVHLTRNGSSFKRATRLAEAPELAKHVRRLIYHTDEVPDQDMYADFQTFCEQYQHARDLQSRLMNLPTPLPLSKAKLHALHGNLLEELRTQQSFIRAKADTEQLIILMTKFTGLVAMECYDDFGSPEAPEGYISRRTGLMPDELATGSPQKYLFWLLTASFHADALVSRLASSVHDWEMFTRFGKCKDILRGQLSGLRVLELTFDSVWLVRASKIKKARLGFVAFLNAAPNLKSLTLEMGELPWITSAQSHDGPRVVADAILKSIRWPKLKHLSISGLAATEQDLIGFFAIHATSLRTLRLGHVEMPLQCTGKGSRIVYRKNGSVISLFTRLRDICTLHNVSLWGRFGNRWDEAWYVPQEQEGPKGCIRAEIEEFISHRGDSPFVGLERYFRPGSQDQHEFKGKNPENSLYWSDDDFDDGEGDDGKDEDEDFHSKEEDTQDENDGANADDADEEDIDSWGDSESESVDEDIEGDEAMEPEELSDRSWVWCHQLLR
jgi:hypothetical protein